MVLAIINWIMRKRKNLSLQNGIFLPNLMKDDIIVYIYW